MVFENDSEDMNICERLRYLREKHMGPRSKQKFAAALGIPLSTYSNYEAERVPPPEILVKASDVTGCDLEWLMTGKFSGKRSSVSDPEVSEILERMEKLISGRPQARQAVTALLDLLSVRSPAKPKPMAISEVMNQGHVIPILGRAVAGLPAVWEASDQDLRDLSGIIQLDQTQNIRMRFETDLVDPILHCGAGQVEVIQLATPIGEESAPIDGVILTEHFEGRGNLFAVRLMGDSMEPKLSEGDYVIADSGTPAERGGICLAELYNRVGAVCKMYYPEDSRIRLSSLNETYQPIVVDRGDVTWVFKVVAAVKQSSLSMK